MQQLTLVSVLIAIAGLAFIVTGIRRLIQRRFFKAAGLEFSGLLFLLLASSAFLLSSDLSTYQRLVYEQAVAKVTFKKLSARLYRADIRALDSGFQQSITLAGDEWKLDAQVLAWRGLASLFGLDANYRLHQVSARYTDKENEPHRVFLLLKEPALVETEWFDLWQFADKHRDWLRWLDAADGRAVFLPMTDGASYKVDISRTGLVARPANDEAKKAVSQWIGL